MRCIQDFIDEIKQDTYTLMDFDIDKFFSTIPVGMQWKKEEFVLTKGYGNEEYFIGDKLINPSWLCLKELFFFTEYNHPIFNEYRDFIWDEIQKEIEVATNQSRHEGWVTDFSLEKILEVFPDVDLHGTRITVPLYPFGCDLEGTQATILRLKDEYFFVGKNNKKYCMNECNILNEFHFKYRSPYNTEVDSLVRKTLEKEIHFLEESRMHLLSII